ncbi:NrfD/PsrC family molybdoenzyme membrane anchor subunit [Schinkia azotoformans]|uniref:NrfD/PsrC family molybdoenzyme membrane anchor subunit n=1 Tax=Schinkia azotoformans TaxID=1454 RepID=UPI002DB8106F|nr:NrfD/PsrC family molybdoenzyme membrane anchor subunit [Schinkia azotoformans]MEC1718927.1 polysulfide reductase NrfD [Schinkia azotoformans]MED4412861.1 polysulfide reductase NrfD [Schinkia azotoformans]
MEAQVVHAVWDFRVVIDLFLGGVGVGLFLLATYFSFTAKEKHWTVIKTGYILSPVFVGAGVLSLMTELGKPLRMFSTYIHFNPTSITSWGGYIQTLFILASFLIIYFLFKTGIASFSNNTFKFIQITGLLLAVGTGMYHGLLLASLGRPLWMNGLIPVLFFLSSIIAGASLLIVLGSVSSKVFHSVEDVAIAEVAATSRSSKSDQPLTYLFTILLVLQVVLMIVWRATLQATGLEAVGNYQLMMEHYGSIWWIAAIGLGLIVPLAISINASIRKVSFSMGSAVILMVSTLIGSYAFKHIIVYAGQLNVPNPFM